MDIKLSESHYDSLKLHETELINNYEAIIRHFTKEWVENNKSVEVNHFSDKTEIAKYVENKLNDIGIKFNGSKISIWFNGMGKGNMLYWGWNENRKYDSVVVSGINEILMNK